MRPLDFLMASLELRMAMEPSSNSQGARMTEHTNKQFDTDLESVRSQFLAMGGVVETMIQDRHRCTLGQWRPGPRR